MMLRSLALRLARLEAQTPAQAWQHTEGLCALLGAAQRLPAPVATWEEEEKSAMGTLLAEARQWVATHPRAQETP